MFVEAVVAVIVVGFDMLVGRTQAAVRNPDHSFDCIGRSLAANIEHCSMDRTAMLGYDRTADMPVQVGSFVLQAEKLVLRAGRFLPVECIVCLDHSVG